MPTRLYRFHCTDGYDLIVDRRGKRMPTLALMRRHAERVALDLMRLGAQIDWSAWQVEVYDAKGRSVWMRTFVEVRDARPKVRHQGNARMAMKTTFVVQTFVIKRKRLVPGDREVAPTESGALKKAEAMAGRLPGTAALKIVADDETGELEGATILGQFGEVPDDFAESLQGG